MRAVEIVLSRMRVRMLLAAMRALREGATLEDASRLAEAADRKVNYFAGRADDNSLALNQSAQAPEQSVAPTVQGYAVPAKVGLAQRQVQQRRASDMANTRARSAQQAALAAARRRRISPPRRSR